MTSEFGDLLKAAVAAVHALRSYQHGNASPELAEEIADELEKAVNAALDGRDRQLESFRKTISELQTMVEEFATCIDPTGVDTTRH